MNGLLKGFELFWWFVLFLLSLPYISWILKNRKEITSRFTMQDREGNAGRFGHFMENPRIIGVGKEGNEG